MAFENLFIRVKKSIGGIQLDGVIEERHTNTVRVTSNPVEFGADVNDHAIIDPKIINIRGVVTDTPIGFAAVENLVGSAVSAINSVFGSSTEENQTRTQQAYKTLIELMEIREPIEIQTGLKLYENMLITAVSVSQDKDTSRIVMLDITAQEIIITESEVVELSGDNLSGDTKTQASPSIDKGRQEPIETDNKSILKSVGDFLS